MQNPTKPATSAKGLLGLGGLLILTLILFLPVRDFGFINLDDPYLVQHNAELLRAFHWDLLWQPVAGLYHPLTNLTFWLDARRAGLNPGAFHVTNLGFHLLAVVGVWFWSLRRSGGELATAAIITAVFAWHATHIESVAWISERKDVVSGAFFWLGLAAHAHGRPWWAIALFALSLLGKPSFLLLPALIAWSAYWDCEDRRPGWAAILRRHAPVLGATAVFTLIAGALAIYAQGEVRAEGTWQAAQWPWRLPLQLVFYVAKTVWPFELRIVYTDYDLWPTVRDATLAGAFVLLSLWMAWRDRVFRSDLWFGWGFFALVIFPMLKVIPFGDSSWVADRYLYVSQTGLLWPWARWVARAAGALSWRHAIATALIGVWAYASTERLPDWQSAVTIWESILRHEPYSPEAHENLGRHYLGIENHAKALHHLERGKINDRDNQHNRAFVLMRLGRLIEADYFLRQAEFKGPSDPKVINLRGNWYMELQQYEKAEYFYRLSLAQRPKLLMSLIKAEAQTNLGVLAYRKNQYQECIAWQNEALASLPAYAYAYHNRAICHLALNDLVRAEADYQSALAAQPGFAMAHNGLGVIALKRGQSEQAARHFENALQADPGLQIARDNLNRVRAR